MCMYVGIYVCIFPFSKPGEVACSGGAERTLKRETTMWFGKKRKGEGEDKRSKDRLIDAWQRTLFCVYVASCAQVYACVSVCMYMCACLCVQRQVGCSSRGVSDDDDVGQRNSKNGNTGVTRI